MNETGMKVAAILLACSVLCCTACAFVAGEPQSDCSDAPVSSSADATDSAGWFYADGVLTIHREDVLTGYLDELLRDDEIAALTKIVVGGEMTEIPPYFAYLPFRTIHADVLTILVEEGVTTIGAYAFLTDIAGLKVEVSIPCSAVNMDEKALCWVWRANVDPNHPFLEDKQGCIIDTHTQTLLAVSEEHTNVTIPDDVVAIAASAFASQDTITSVTMPNSVISIGENAFDGCVNLKEFAISDKIEEIGFAALSGTAMDTVILPESLQSAGEVDSIWFQSRSLKTLIVTSPASYLKEAYFGWWPNLRYLVVMGAPPAELDIALAENEFRTGHDGNDKEAGTPDQFTIVYLNAYADLWAPNGETEWNGFPLVGIDSLDDLPPLD